MALLLVIGSLILLALAALRWGHDSRRLLDAEPWLADRAPNRPGGRAVAAALAATCLAVARLRPARRAHAHRRRLRARTAGVLL